MRKGGEPVRGLPFLCSGVRIHAMRGWGPRDAIFLHCIATKLQKKLD